MLGRATIEAIRKLERLTKAPFKGDMYEAAGETSTALEGKSSEAGVIAIEVTGVMATTAGVSSVAGTI